MRTLQFFFCICCASLALGADDYWEVLRDLKHNGGIARFELTVKDDQGVPVEDAEGSASFYSPSKGLEGNQDHSSSDANGHLVLSERSYYNGRYVVQKEGYYATEGYAVLQPPEEKAGAFERRRWVPVVEEVTLKRKINPIPMYAWRVWLPVPALDKPLPLDLEKMEWCAPYGEGVHEDMWVILTSELRTRKDKTFPVVKTVTFEFRGDYNGVLVCDADEWSQLQSSHQVNTQAEFASTLTLPRDHYFTIPSDKYLVYRVRSKVSPEGVLLSANYGKIYSKTSIETKEIAFLAVYFNPTENDTNLEFDPKRNLVPEEKLDYWKRSRALAP